MRCTALLAGGRQPQDGPNTEANLTGNLADTDAPWPHGQCGFDLAVAVLGVFGNLRPRCMPSCFARARPASTRSRIMARSNSANTPIIWSIARPLGVEVSSPCAAYDRRRAHRRQRPPGRTRLLTPLAPMVRAASRARDWGSVSSAGGKCRVQGRRKYLKGSDRKVGDRPVYTSCVAAEVIEARGLSVKRHPELPPLRHEELPPPWLHGLG
jgi:hypothetical protein